MTQPIEIPPLANHPICLYVGNTPVAGHVLELSGLALRLAVSGDVGQVPRVRVELEDEDAPLSSLQLQGMVTRRGTGEVTITLERLMIAAGKQVVHALLNAWFPAVPQVEGCYQQMMRGYGYELRKAIMAGRSPSPSAPPEPPPARPASRPLPESETISGIPVAAVTAAKRARAAEQAPAPPPPSAPPPPPPVTPPQPIAVPRAPRGTLPLQVLRTAERLLDGTVPALLWIDCSMDAPGPAARYGRGVVYRMAAEGRVVFVAVRGFQPGFGAKVQLIVDLQQGGATHTVRVDASVAWSAPDPDAPGICLLVARLAPANQAQTLQGWFMACQFATEQVAPVGPISALPARDLLDGLRAAV